jgi:HJR/Mrr/RecB family endonuclease
MEPVQFEHWALRCLADAGYRVERTSRTHDGGADGLAFPADDGQLPLLIQCKHTQRPDEPCGPAAIADLLRARVRYGQGEWRLVAVSNARSFTAAALTQAKQEGVELVALADLLRWPNIEPQTDRR